jgi:hypothetical protein
MAKSARSIRNSPSIRIRSSAIPTWNSSGQAISEILPDGDKEKQLVQGLLNQREGLEEATRQRALF